MFSIRNILVLFKVVILHPVYSYTDINRLNSTTIFNNLTIAIMVMIIEMTRIEIQTTV